MRVFISSDMEGTAGIVDWSQCRGPGAAYDAGCALLLGEVNAAIEGATDGGASEILVNDSHGAMVNLAPAALHGHAGYVSGRYKPSYMMEHLSPEFGAALFVSYHGSMGSSGVLSHTYNPRAVSEVRLNGSVTGEAGINALVALAHKVPVALITGDQVTIEESVPWLPGVVGVVVKEAVSRFSAVSLHPDEARHLIHAGAREAIERARRGEVPLPRIDLPATLEVSWLTTDMADIVGPLRGVERIGSRVVAMRDDDPLRLFETFVTSIALTRSVVDS
ncbi:MAG: M55 family metallopeptidase [Acidimicrobiales bacterium]